MDDNKEKNIIPDEEDQDVEVTEIADNEKLEQIKRKKRVPFFWSVLIVIVTAVLFVAASWTFEYYRSKGITIVTVNTLVDSYLNDLEEKSIITDALLKTYQTEANGVLRILTDYEIYEYSTPYLEACIEYMQGILSRTEIRDIYVVDENGNTLLTSDKEIFGTNVVREELLTKEKLNELISAARQSEENQDDQNGVLINYDPEIGYYICRQIARKDGTPSSYYMTLVFKNDQIDEVIRTSNDRTVLASALSTNSEMMELSVYMDGGFLFSTIENAEAYTPVLLNKNKERYTDDSIPTDGIWGELRLVPKNEAGEELSYPTSYVRCVQDPLGNTIYAIGSVDPIKKSGIIMQLSGAAFGGALILLALVLVNSVYYLYCYKTSILVKRYSVLTVGNAVVSVLVFCLAVFYFQSVEDLTEISMYADKVQERITEMEAYEKTQYEAMSEYFKKADLRQMDMIAYGLEIYEDQLNDESLKKVYYQTGADGHYLPIQDTLGNEMSCFAGTQLLSASKLLLDQADIWLINDLGYAIASSSETGWCMNTNQTEDKEIVRQVLRGESAYVYEYNKDASGMVQGTKIVCPVTLYMMTENGQTVYLSKEQYEKKISDSAAEEGKLKALTGALLVRLQEEPEALRICRERYKEDLNTVANRTYSNIIPLVKQEDGTMAAGENIIYSGRDNLDLKEITVPAEGASQKVFSYFRTVSRTNCFFHVINNFSKNESNALCFTTDLVHQQRPLMVTIYTILAALAIFGSWAVFRAGKKTYNAEIEAVFGTVEEVFESFRRKHESTESSEEDENDKTDDYLNFVVRVLKRSEKSGLNAETISIILVQIVLILCGMIIVNDLFLTKQYGESALFINIYSPEWERCFNFYNVVAMLALVLINFTVFNLVRSLVDVFCVPFGGKVATYAKLIVSIMQYALLFIEIFYGAYLMGMELKSLGTMATVVAGVIGIGSQALISDIGSGIAILAEGRYMIGDLVQVDMFVGRIRDIGIRNCILVNDENVEKSVSNSKMNSAMLLTNRVPKDGGDIMKPVAAVKKAKPSTEETNEKTDA